ncbi:MAG: prolipoprotein diacylglyceryl transferase [Clostridia bacterium]|nr:prolipoprotein diacylglyceryl transferase [Clostridia bacterium]
MNTISFEQLGLHFHINRVAFQFGNLKVHWYALIILTGVILGFLYATIFAKRENLETDTLYDVLLWGLPSAIIGARLYYVVFNFSEYAGRFWDVFKIWQGGIAIYGAVIGAAISTYIYAKVKKIPALQLFDMGAFGLMVGQAVGRWGNFVNQEAFGTNTDSVFAMSGNLIHAQLVKMQSMGMAVNPDMGVHPTFFYESIWNLFGAILLGLFHKKKKHHGQMFSVYLVWYGIGRFFIEGLRTDSLYFFSFRISQVVALVTVILGMILLIYFYKKPLCKPLEQEIDVAKNEEEKETAEETAPPLNIIDKEIKRNEDKRRT